MTSTIPTPHMASAQLGLRHVFVRDLLLECVIGIYDHEKEASQRVRLNLDLAVQESDTALDDNYDNVVCYAQIVEKARKLVAKEHINLVETLAERLAGICFEDHRVRTCRVRVEKLDVFSDAQSVGVEIERHNPHI